MILLSLSLFVLFVIAGPAQQNEAHYFAKQPSSTGLSNQKADGCQVGARSVVVDGKNLNETLSWKIGEVKSQDGETFCKTVMPMRNDPAWQYAVTTVEWTSHVMTEENTQAAIQFAFSFENNPRVSRYRWTIDGGKNENWRSHMTMNPLIFSPCGQAPSLVFEWRVAFNLNKGKGGGGTVNGIVGAPHTDNGHLQLQVGTKWKKCA